MRGRIRFDEQVYPRVCGGTCARHSQRSPRWGLSPRVRGNLHHILVRGQRVGSIPACAGEPYQIGQEAGLERVYPRVCGGTLTIAKLRSDILGLSPRVRGNRG